MSGRIDTRKNLDRAVVGPALALPVPLVVAGIDFDLDDPFNVLDAVEAWYQQSEREAMFLGQLFPVHQEGEHHVILHRPCERNAVVVAVDAAKDHIARGLTIGSAVDEQLLERDAAPRR